jgi:glycosyltransferase involved in cell wall biosynthesis
LRILFLHEVNYLTKPVFEMHEFPEHLAKLGHEVGFVHFPEGYSQREIRELGRRRSVTGRAVSAVQLELFTPWTLTGNLMGRLFTALLTFWQFKRILEEYRPDVVISYSVPTSGWQALIAARFQKVPYVFRALDVSHKIRKGVFSNLVRSAEKFIYGKADGLSVNNLAMLRYCNALGRREKAGEIHYPPLDLEAFQNGNRIRGRATLGLDSETHMTIYLGSFFYFSGLGQVVRAWKALPASGTLVLVGAGEQDKELRNLVRELGLETKVLFTGMVPFSDLPDLLAAADLAINPMERSLVSNTALPNKVIQYLAAGKWVCSTRLEGLESTFADNPYITWLESPEDVGRFAAQASTYNRGNLQSGTERLALLFGELAIRNFEAFIQKLAGDKS